MKRFQFTSSILKKGSALCVAFVFAHSFAAAQAGTTIKPYLVPTAESDYEIIPLLSVADRVALLGGAGGEEYQMVGIPDGLSAYPNGDGTATLLMNHEFVNTTTSQPVIGGPEFRGAFVSRFLLAADGSVLAGAPAYSKVFQDDTFVGEIQTTANPEVPAFGRFCSASLSGREAGLDRPIYFANEEVSGPTSAFDPRGGQAVVVFQNDAGEGEAHALSSLGFFAWENSLVMPRQDKYTVIMGNEDGPSTPDSQLYMYVGKKNRNGATVLERNGLINGRLFVFAPLAGGPGNEDAFTSGTIAGRWVEIANASSLTDAELEVAADAAGAFGFYRIEDGTFDKGAPTRDYYFVTTGSVGANVLGRMYRLRFGRSENPLAGATLRIVDNADQVVAAGGDTALSPDNTDNNGSEMLVCEDGTTASRAVMAAKGRDGSVWGFALDNNLARTRQAELDPPGRDGVIVTEGVWESSGVFDTTNLFGPGTWLIDVQAHAPTTAPGTGTVEDGQLLLMRPLAAR